ncbi:zinc-binding protein A33-like [Eucyclogobius newberryi]|uniref:zinc-binding protein A33-like n=1 Tax=Eucyclogobius newberryi TaxID=166745 RepID=UPI003B5C1BED
MRKGVTQATNPSRRIITFSNEVIRNSALRTWATGFRSSSIRKRYNQARNSAINGGHAIQSLYNFGERFPLCFGPRRYFEKICKNRAMGLHTLCLLAQQRPLLLLLRLSLREEQSRQAQTIEPQLQKIREKLSTLEQNILTVEEQLKRQSMDFIREYRHTHETTQTLLSQPGPELGPGLLINQAKVLGNMGFKAWDKMRALVHYSPVLLDPNTAERWFYLSEDLRGVRYGETEHQQVPLKPKRFTEYANVLACEGFSSGSHQWDVEVGDHPRWTIGVTKESVDRKRERGADPENGLWCLKLKGGKYYDVVCKTLILKRSPQRIRVRLDYDKGKLSFSDAEDMSLICSHEERFTEKMFPYFSVGEAGDAKTKEIKICSTEGH